MRHGRKIPLWLYGLNVAVLGALAAWLFTAYGYEKDGMLLMTRWTARVSFTFFILAFTASALVKLKAGRFAKWQLRNRRHLGLNFALAHFVHLWALGTWSVMSGTPVETVTLIFGGAAYVFVALLAVTSTDAAVRKMGHNWRRLHLTGVWYIWFIFTYTFFGRVFEKPWYWIAVAIGLAAASLRLTAHLRQRAARPASA